MTIYVEPVDCDTLWIWELTLRENGETWRAQAIEEDIFEVLKLASFLHDWNYPFLQREARETWRKVE